jgi:hypothetical protein
MCGSHTIHAGVCGWGLTAPLIEQLEKEEERIAKECATQVRARGVRNTVVSPCVADPRRHCTYLWVQGSLSRLLSSLLGVGSLLKKGQEAPGGKGLEDAVVAAGPIAHRLDVITERS